MKIYTQSDFAAFVRRADGYLYLPAGRYVDIDFKRADRLTFAAGSEIDACGKIGDGCILGNRCYIGCDAGDYLTAGDGCVFGQYFEMGDGGAVGAGSVFGPDSAFGEDCAFNAINT